MFTNCPIHIYYKYEYFECIIDISNTNYGKSTENCAVLTNKG
jgi:hypothetical protein